MKKHRDISPIFKDLHPAIRRAWRAIPAKGRDLSDGD